MESAKTDVREELEILYAKNGADTPLKKIELLRDKAKGKSFSFFACGGEVTETMKLKMLEREFLIQSKKIMPELV